MLAALCQLTQFFVIIYKANFPTISKRNPYPILTFVKCNIQSNIVTIYSTYFDIQYLF